MRLSLSFLRPSLKIGRHAAMTAISVAVVAFPAAGQVQTEVACPNIDGSTDFRPYTAGANITWTQPTPLVPVPDLFAWEQAKVTVTDAVNVNREIYEERKCNWFGINCWYEKRVRNNPVTANQVPLHYFATLLGGGFDPNSIEGRTEIKKTGETQPIAENYDEYWRGATVTTLRALRGMIGHQNAGINRTSCEGQPRVCSVGAYTVKVEIDSLPRARRFVQELNRQRYTYDALMSPNVLNANMRQSNGQARACLADALYSQAMTFHGPGSDSTPAERQKILQQALNFNPTNLNVRTALGSTYLETGQFDEARAQTTSAISDLEKLVSSGGATSAHYVQLADNYATLAETSWRETAGNSTRAANEAAGSLRLAIDRLEARLKRFPLDEGAVAARTKLVEHSIRLAQVLARLGTSQDMSQAVEIIAKARNTLPKRISNVTPLESDAVAGVATMTRADAPLFADRSWKLDVDNLAVSNGQALTSFATDPRGANNPAVFSLGSQHQMVQEFKELVGSGRADNLLSQAEQCVADAAILSPRRTLAVTRQGSGGGTTTELLLSGDQNRALEVKGELGASVIARGGPSDRVATLAWRESSLGIEQGWHFVESDAALTNPRSAIVLAGERADEPMLRAGPGGTFYAVGLRKPGGVPRWSLLGLKDNQFVSSAISCRDNREANVPIDDVALIEGSTDQPEVTILGVSAHCLAHVSPAKAGEGVTLIPREKDTTAAEALLALKDRTTAFAWATKRGEPFAVLSWNRSQGRLAPSTYKLLVSRWSFSAEEQSPTRRPLYQADIAGWAVMPPNGPVCPGFASGYAKTPERFRITKLSIVSETKAGQLLERPAVQAAVAGVYGGLSLHVRPKSELAKEQALTPSNLSPNAPVLPVSVGAVPTLQKSGSDGRPRNTAVCNAGHFRDYQFSSDDRVWALRRSDLSLVRLLGEASDTCEGPALIVGPGAVMQRLYAPPTSEAHDLLQVIDADEDGRVLRLTLAKPPADTTIQGQPQPEITTPATCGLTSPLQAGTCDIAALRKAISASANEVRVLARDISTDPGRKGQGRSFDTVERPTAILFFDQPTDGQRTVRVLPFPVRLPLTSRMYRIPEDATVIGTLVNEGPPVLVAFVSSLNKLISVNENGAQVASFELTEKFRDRSTTRRLVARSRMLFVSQGAPDTEAEILVIALKEGRLEVQACTTDCKLQTDAMIDDLARRLRLGPALTPEGRTERFAADGELTRILFPTAKDKTLTWNGWRGIPFGGAEGPVLQSAGAGIPLLLDANRALVAPQPGIVEIWRIGQ